MDPKKLRASLGLAEDATDDAVEARIAELNAGQSGGSGAPSGTDGNTNPQGGGAPAPATPPPATSPAGGTDTQLSELRQLAEGSPALRALVDRMEAQEKLLADTQAALRLAETGRSVTRLNEIARGKGRELPAVVLNELPALLGGMPRELSDRVVGVVEKLAEVGFVPIKELGDSGGGNTNRESGGDAVKAFTGAVEAAMKANDKLSYIEAVQQVSTAQPQLYAAYAEATSIKA